jgi:hypothetical protein
MAETTYIIMWPIRLAKRIQEGLSSKRPCNQNTPCTRSFHLTVRWWFLPKSWMWRHSENDPLKNFSHIATRFKQKIIPNVLPLPREELKWRKPTSQSGFSSSWNKSTTGYEIRAQQKISKQVGMWHERGKETESTLPLAGCSRELPNGLFLYFFFPRDRWSWATGKEKRTLRILENLHVRANVERCFPLRLAVGTTKALNFGVWISRKLWTVSCRSHSLCGWAMLKKKWRELSL